jgi:hypothetical protein
MMTISGTKWFSSWRHLPTTRDIWEPSRYHLGVAAGIVKYGTGRGPPRPPVESWRGTSPIQAAKSRPDRNTFGSAAVATIAVAKPETMMAAGRTFGVVRFVIRKSAVRGAVRW